MIKKYLHSIGKESESFFSINKGRGTYLTEKKIDYYDIQLEGDSAPYI